MWEDLHRSAPFRREGVGTNRFKLIVLFFLFFLFVLLVFYPLFPLRSRESNTELSFCLRESIGPLRA